MNIFLHLASILNRTGCRINAFLYEKGLRKALQAPLPVISVGNIVFGGSGKTPLVIQLLEKLRDWGYRPAVVTRGYKGHMEKPGGTVSDGTNKQIIWMEAGDEPFMIAHRLPWAGVYVGRNRYRSCIKARNDGFHIIVLDDGFQHLRLERDVDIVLHQPGRSFLRESSAALKRADYILESTDQAHERAAVLNFQDPDCKVFSFAPYAEGFFDSEGQPVEEEQLKDSRITAFCSIADPGRFRASLEARSLQLDRFLAFPDHHAYPPSTLNRLRPQAGKNAVFLTTEKDIFKIPQGILGPAKLYYLRIGLKIQESFYTCLRDRLPLPPKTERQEKI